MGANASKHVDYLKGPVSLTFYKNPKTGKEIYIFGDEQLGLDINWT